MTARPGSATRTDKPYQALSRTVRVAGLEVQPGHWAHPEPAPHGKPAVQADLLIDCEEDRTLRAVLVGMLRETS